MSLQHAGLNVLGSHPADEGLPIQLLVPAISVCQCCTTMRGDMQRPIRA